MNMLNRCRSALSRFTKSLSASSGSSPNRSFKPDFEALENRMLPSAANTAVVQAMYQDLLHRAADPGSAGFVSQLNSGVPAATVAYEIETNSANEYRVDLVGQFYMTFLDRVGAPPELNAWAQAMASGLSDQQVEAAIVASPEYFALHGNTAVGFLNGLYQDALGRPDTEGAWLTQLNQGVSRQAVANAVFSSPEGELHQVLADYEQFLERSGVGDPGATAFTQAMLNGTSQETVVSDMIGSQEYLALHNITVPTTVVSTADNNNDAGAVSDSNSDDPTDPGTTSYTPPVDDGQDTPPVDPGQTDPGTSDDTTNGYQSDQGTSTDSSTDTSSTDSSTDTSSDTSSDSGDQDSFGGDDSSGF